MVDQSVPENSKTLYLIDGHSLIYQAFYAIRNLSAPTGEPTNAVFGLTAMLRKIMNRNPDYVVMVLDSPGPTFRHQAYPDYKATRKPMPDELMVQLPMIDELLEGYRIRRVARPGFEGDDIMATLAGKAEAVGVEAYLLTSDKDAQQLLTDHVMLYDYRTDQVTDAQALAREKGIRSDQVVDYMALTGDSSDNVPGVPGIGPKTALELIRKYETLEGVLAHIDEIPGAKRQENLRQYADQARMSRQLVTLDRDMSLDLDLEDCRVRRPDAARLLTLFRRWGFRNLTDELLAETGKPEIEHHLVDTPETFEEFMKQLTAQEEIAVDLETTSLMPLEAEIVGLSFAWEEGEAWYLPVKGPGLSRVLPYRKTLDRLAPLLGNPQVRKVGQNLKYDSLVLAGHDISLAPIAFDTMVASYTLNPGRRLHNLSDLAADFLGRPMTPITDLIGKGRQQVRMDEVAVETVSDYACDDADVALALTHLLRKRLQESGFDKLYREVELPLIAVLRDMELAGIRVDTGLLGKLSEEFGGRLAELETQIYREAEVEFNIGSTRQLSEILFTKLKLPTLKRIKTGHSTDQEVLEGLRGMHPLPDLILKYRSLSKLKSTYLDSLPHMVNPKTGRIHASFNQTVTATGRLSSSDPNLQNIPVRTEEGGRIRAAFIPESADQVLLSADYSQIELRLLAHFSGDPELVRAFREGRDIHAFVAAQVNGVELSQVTPAMRSRVKAVNFGIMYGLSPYGLSKQIGISPEEAREFIDRYYARYKGVERFFDEVLEGARKNGYVSTILDRRRYIEGVRPPEERAQQRNQAERIAVNTVCQGSAADLIKVAMIHIHRRLRDEKLAARMLLQIHDELLFEVPRDEVKTLTDLVRREMTEAIELSVPLVVNVGAGDNWLETK